jgi:hypothetical protein
MHPEKIHAESKPPHSLSNFVHKRFHSEFKLTFKQFPPRHAATLRKGVPSYEPYFPETDPLSRMKVFDEEEMFVHRKSKCVPMSNGLQFLNHPKLKTESTELENLIDASIGELDRLSIEARCSTPGRVAMATPRNLLLTKSVLSNIRHAPSSIKVTGELNFNEASKISQSHSKITHTREFKMRVDQRAQWRRQSHENCCQNGSKTCHLSRSQNTRKETPNNFGAKSVGPKAKVRKPRRQSSV